ncbi:MAG TPA: copper oxidase [Geobacter sp.]|nr:copper oxidase [Geobacter sp.]
MFHGHFWQDRGWHGKSRHAFSVGALIYALLSIVPAQAATLDVFGPPPPGDPSAYTGPFIGRDYARDFLATLPPANEGALEGSSHEAVGANNVLPPQLQESTNVPTNSKPSPLFGAQPFTQQMLLFEEFGTEPYPAQGSTTATPFPPPTLGPAPEQDPEHVAESGPAGTVLEAFLAQPGIAPYPTEFSNNLDVNPWRRVIEQFLGRALVNPPAEGRPPGQGWAHQRYNEFFPQVYYKTAQAGSRMNGGFRDTRQMHRYSVGEFGPGGLYHRVFSSPVPGAPTLEGSTNGLAIRIHPLMPVQDHKSVWTFDGTLPPKLLMVRYGQPVLMRHYNALPVDPAANRGFGLHTITTHEHNGHSPAESDGYANAFFFPGQFYDYRWPLQLAGYDSINTSATDPRAAFPCAPGETLFVNDATPALKSCQNGSIRIRGDWRETMSTHWFHDHMMDFTAQNVYKGNAVMMNYYSALDRGKEDFNDGVNLRLPSGTALPWGNRDYDVNLLLADKAWDKNGQLWFNIFNLDGFIGDHILTNWLYDPYLDVRARSYRFRILNGSVSRYLAVALVQQVQGSAGEIPGPPGSNVSYNRVPFHMIANDGNLMEHTVPFDGSMDLYNTGNPLAYKGQLPTQGIAERYDIIVNFGKHGIRPGDKLYFVNVLEHTGGRRPGDRIALEAILSEQYKPLRQDDDNDGVADRWVGGDPAVGKFLELRVQAYSGQDLSMNPVDFEPGKKAMIPLTIHRDDPADQAKLARARHRTFEFVRSGGSDLAPWTVKTDNGDGFGMDSRRLSAAPQLANGPTSAGYSGEGTLEIWSIEGNGGWSHPVHVHFEEGVILRRGGKVPPEWEKWARKDVYRVGPEADSTESVEMAIRFREFAGTYMEHCHNTQHEDHSMLLRWDIEHPGQVQLMPSPLPTWDGVYYVDSAALPTFRSGDGIGPALLKPTGTIVINGGATVTNSKTATLTLSASSAAGAVTQMQFSKDGVNFFPLEPFAATRVVTLLPGDGVKTMTVRFRDSAGNVSASISASIVRDSVKPVGTIAFSTPDPTTSATGHPGPDGDRCRRRDPDAVQQGRG